MLRVASTLSANLAKQHVLFYEMQKNSDPIPEPILPTILLGLADDVVLDDVDLQLMDFDPLEVQKKEREREKGR